MSQRLKVCFDLDGVIFDFHEQTFAKLAAMGHDVRIDELKFHNIHELYPQHADLITEIAQDPRTYAVAETIWEGVEAADFALMYNVDVYFATARPEHCREATLAKLQELFEASALEGRVHMMGSSARKAEFIKEQNFDFIIDDNPNLGTYLEKLDFPTNRLLIFEQSWNRESLGFKRVNGYQIRSILEDALNKHEKLLL